MALELPERMKNWDKKAKKWKNKADRWKKRWETAKQIKSKLLGNTSTTIAPATSTTANAITPSPQPISKTSTLSPKSVVSTTTTTQPTTETEKVPKAPILGGANNFPRFPTETDIMAEVVNKNVDKIQRTCRRDIRGRNRACCNSASRCFDDVKSVVDELDNAEPGTFALMSACRQVSSELKRDKICVQRSLARCGGPDRVVLQRRFNNRVDTLYDQFYKHCNRSPVTDSPTTDSAQSTVEATTVVNNNGITLPEGITTRTVTGITDGGVHIPLSKIPGWNNNPDGFPPVTPHNHSTHDHNRNIIHESGPSSGSGAVLAGAITGGIVLLLVLIVGLVFWCRSRREKNGSNGSYDSAGIFFQKRPNMFSTDRPRGENNNKHPLTRQESAIYAEIDEAKVNPGYKPPVPGNMPSSYLSPISDEDSYTPPPSNLMPPDVPMATTRGQLSYGPILAANGVAESQNKNLFYHSASVTDPRIHNREAFLTQKNLQSGAGNESADGAYITSDSLDVSNDSLDDYEEPISANTSLRYAQIESNTPPGHQAPEVPIMAPEKKLLPKNAVNVFPSNPFAPFKDTNKSDDEPDSVTQPIAKPRRRKDQTSDDMQESLPMTDGATSGKMADNEILKRADLMAGNRDSAMSDSSAKSSHHYFVLEPDNTKMEYENAVSSSKLV